MALVGGTCWGFSGCCGQYLFEQKGIEAPWLVAVRLFFAGIILVLAGFKLHGRENLRVFRKKRDTIHLLAFAIFGITFCQFTYFMAIQASNAGTATVLQYLSPILILAVVCMRELRLPKGLELAAIGLSLFGTFVIGTHGDIHSFHITGEALFWGLLAAVSSMIYTIIPGGLILKYDIYQVLGFGMFFGGIAMGAVVQPWNYGWSGMLVHWERWQAWWWWALPLHLACDLQGVSMIGPLKGSIMGRRGTGIRGGHFRVLAGNPVYAA